MLDECYELTGYEEHLRDQADECGELVAMREEAYREAALEAAMAQAERDEEEAAYRARYPGGFCIEGSGRMCERSDDPPF